MSSDVAKKSNILLGNQIWNVWQTVFNYLAKALVERNVLVIVSCCNLRIERTVFLFVFIISLFLFVIIINTYVVFLVSNSENELTKTDLYCHERV